MVTPNNLECSKGHILREFRKGVLFKFIRLHRSDFRELGFNTIQISPEKSLILYFFLKLINYIPEAFNKQ